MALPAFAGIPSPAHIQGVSLSRVPVCPGDPSSSAGCVLWGLLTVQNADLKSQEYPMEAVPAQLRVLLATTEVKCAL